MPHVFHSGAELLALAAGTGKPIAELMRENEEASLSSEELSARLAGIAEASGALIAAMFGNLAAQSEGRSRDRELRREDDPRAS